MKYLYSVYDRKAAFYLTPFVARTNSEAVRMIAQSMTGESSLIQKYPQDYELWAIGNFEENSGTIDEEDHHPQMICSCTTIMEEIVRSLRSMEEGQPGVKQPEVEPEEDGS